jgi:HAMP domain-containing protein
MAATEITPAGATSGRRRWRRLAVPLLLAAAAAAVFAYGVWRQASSCRFIHPVAWTLTGDTLAVVEKRGNTVIALQCAPGSHELMAKTVRRIEPDDASFYYMVRSLFPGTNGVVVQSYVYERATRRFVGYRFSEYESWTGPPHVLLRVTFAPEQQFPEFIYAAGPDGSHLFAHDLPGRRNLWRLPAAAAVVVDATSPGPSHGVRELGDLNDGLASWAGLLVAPDGSIFATNRASGRVVEYAPDGQRRREFGQVGFAEGELLAPTVLSIAPLTPGGPARLTVASTGNRSWVQFDEARRAAATLTLLGDSYPFADLLIGPVYPLRAGGAPWTFDLVNRAAVRLDVSPALFRTYRQRGLTPPPALAAAALALLLVALALYRWGAVLGRVRIPLFVRLMGAFVPLLVAVALGVGEWTKSLLRREVEAEMVRRCANLAHAMISSLDPADLAAIQRPEDREGDAYRRVHATLTRLVGVGEVPDTPKWILLKRQQGRYYFGVSLWRGAIFEPFVLSTEQGHEIHLWAAREKHPAHGRTVDEQGEWFSYVSPVLNPAGGVDYLLELYRPSEELYRADAEIERRLLELVAVAVLAGIGLAVLFAYGVTRPLRHLAASADLARRGQFDGALAVRSLDEVGMLANAFDQVRRQRQRAEDLLRVVIPIGSAMAREHEFDRLLATILDRAQDLCRADGGLLYLLRDGQRLEHVLLRLKPAGIMLGGTGGPPLAAPTLALAAPAGESVPIAVHVANTGAPVNLPDAARAADSGLRLPPVLASVAPDFHPVSWLSLPLKATDGTTIGVLELVNAHEHRSSALVPFDAGMEEMVSALSVLAGAALAAYLREKALRHEIHDLRIKIDELKRDQDVEAITESDYFQELLRRADQLRGPAP